MNNTNKIRLGGFKIDEVDHKNKTIYIDRLKRDVSYKYLIKLECYKIIKHLFTESEYIPFSFKDI